MNFVAASLNRTHGNTDVRRVGVDRAVRLLQGPFIDSKVRIRSKTSMSSTRPSNLNTNWALRPPARPYQFGLFLWCQSLTALRGLLCHQRS